MVTKDITDFLPIYVKGRENIEELLFWYLKLVMYDSHIRKYIKENFSDVELVCHCEGLKYDLCQGDIIVLILRKTISPGLYRIILERGYDTTVPMADTIVKTGLVKGPRNNRLIYKRVRNLVYLASHLDMDINSLKEHCYDDSNSELSKLLRGGETTAKKLSYDLKISKKDAEMIINPDCIDSNLLLDEIAFELYILGTHTTHTVHLLES